MVLLNIFTLLCFKDRFTHAEFSTMVVILTALVGVLTVIRQSLPLNPLRISLIVFIVTFYC